MRVGNSILNLTKRGVLVQHKRGIKIMASIAEKLFELETEKNQIQEEYNLQLKKLEDDYLLRIENLNKKCQVLVEAAAIIGESIIKDQKDVSEDDDSNSNSHKDWLTPYPMAIGDAVEKILLENDEPMSLADLRKAAAEMGVSPSPSTFRSAIGKDHRNRFERVELGVYKLREKKKSLFDEK